MMHRSTYVPPPPKLWPIPAGLTIAVASIAAAILFAAPALGLIAWVAAITGLGQLWRCFQWGSHHLNDIEGAFR
jgi:hypothetical protein